MNSWPAAGSSEAKVICEADAGGNHRVHAVSLERDPGNAAAAGAWRDQGKYLATVDILQRMAGNLDAVRHQGAGVCSVLDELPPS
jgi:hypothetical protein